MKLVHLADLHLGYRKYQRQTSAGINQRESDVALAFRKAIDKTIELQPDLVVIAGDIFHNVRPTNTAIVHAYMQFKRMVEMLPDTDVVMVPGNHDTPHTTETGNLLGLFQLLGIHVVIDEPRRILLRGGELSVFAVPWLRPRPQLDLHPLAEARYNVLLIHDVTEGLYGTFGSLAEHLGGELAVEDLHADQWTYVALGHYHVHHKVASNAYYSGGLEYTGTNIWAEVDEELENGSKVGAGKGIVEHDLDTGTHKFHPLGLARRVVDLPELSGVGLRAEDLSAAIDQVVEACDGGIDDKIVRLVVRDVSRHVLRDLDHKAIRDYKRKALHFLLDARRPQPLRTEASGAPGRRASLMETVRSMLENRELTPGIDRKSLVDLGLGYLAEADHAASVSITEAG